LIKREISHARAVKCVTFSHHEPGRAVITWMRWLDSENWRRPSSASAREGEFLAEWRRSLHELAFLAAFRLISPAIGPGGGTIAGYAAALLALLIIEGFIRPPAFFHVNLTEAMSIWRPHNTSWRIVCQTGLRRAVFRAESHLQRGPRYLIRRRPRHRGGFAPLFETLAW
jgi:hypothetical protein